MKLQKCVVIIMFLAVSISASARHKLAPIITNCSLLLPVQAQTLTVVFDTDPKSNTELKECILRNSYSEQSVLLVNEYDTNNNYVEDNTTTSIRRVTDNPNVILISKHLTPKIMDSPLLRVFTRSHWSLTYIIITNNTEFRCENNTMKINDFLKLEDIMNILWHKFKIVHMGVVFPFACKHKMVVYNGKRPSGNILYDRPVQLINSTNSEDIYNAIVKSGDKLGDQYPLRASIFYRYPTSIKDCKNLHYYMPFKLNLTRGFCGLDGLVMHDVLKYLKFNLTFSENDSCNNYGYMVGGNTSGSLGCIIRKELDISFNSRFMTLYSDESIYYLHYVTSDSLCVLVKQPDFIPVWHGVFNVYKDRLWLLLTAIVVAKGAIMWGTAKINKRITGEKTMSFRFYVYDAVMTSWFGCSQRKTKTSLMLRSTCLLCSIFFLAVYQGHINHVYTTLQRFEKIRTLQQLYKSGATLYTSPSMRALIRQQLNTEDSLQLHFLNTSRVIPGDRIEVLLQHKSATTLNRRSDAMMEIFEKYMDKEGKPLIDIVDECFSTYYLSYIARSGFLFYKDMRKFIERLMEAGLPTMYYKWTQQMLGIPSAIPHGTEARPFAKIRLQDQRITFSILLIGYILCIFIFIGEVWRGRCQRATLEHRD